MRITYRMMTSKYSTNLNSLSSDLDKLNTQVATGRKYARTSEDVSSAVRGYQIRRNLSKIEGYQDNIRHADDFLTNTETALGQMESSLSEATDKILQGMNGSQSEDDRKIIATELRTIQDQLLQTLNTSTSGTYLFGGTNNQKPFEDKNGKLYYNGQDLDALNEIIAPNVAANFPGYPVPPSDPTNTDWQNVQKASTLKDDKLYVDIGLGVDFDGAENVKKNTVFEYSIPGIQFVGNGVSKTKVTDSVTGDVTYPTDTIVIDGTTQNISKNMYNLLGQIASEFESDSYTHDNVDKLLGHFKEASQKTYQATTEVGAKTQYLEFMTSRYETQNFNLEERQTTVEGVDAAYTYIAFQSQKVAYSAALQMGQSVVQQSVFDYMS